MSKSDIDIIIDHSRGADADELRIFLKAIELAEWDYFVISDHECIESEGDYSKLAADLKSQTSFLKKLSIEETWNRDGDCISVTISTGGCNASSTKFIQDSDYIEDEFLGLISDFVRESGNGIVSNGEVTIIAPLRVLEESQSLVPDGYIYLGINKPNSQVVDGVAGELLKFLGPDKFNRFVKSLKNSKESGKNKLVYIQESRWDNFAKQADTALPTDFDGIFDLIGAASYADIVLDDKFIFREIGDRVKTCTYGLYYRMEDECIEVGKCNPDQLLYIASDKNKETFFIQFSVNVNLGFILLKPFEKEKSKRLDTWFTNPDHYGEPLTGALSPDGKQIAYIVQPPDREEAELHIVKTEKFNISKSPKAKKVGYNVLNWVDNVNLEWGNETDKESIKVS